jgi:hypothetical protein
VQHAPDLEAPALQDTKVTVSVRGVPIEVTAYNFDGTTLIVTGKLIRVARILDEDWRDFNLPSHPSNFAKRIAEVGVPADIFTFAQKPPDMEVRYPYSHELTSFAVASTADFMSWWEHGLSRATRKHIRKSQKLNLLLREVDFNDELINGLKQIYDESPVRQGRRFWHYGKSLDAIRRENSTYLDRSILIGAYWNSELVGFLKLVRVGANAHVMQLISKQKSFELKTNNAMLAKAVELCAALRIPNLIYGQYIYGKTASSLTEFKRRSGFQAVIVPRYFVATSRWGQIAIRLSLHRDLRSLIPSWIEPRLRNAKWMLTGLINRAQTNGRSAGASIF